MLPLSRSGTDRFVKAWPGFETAGPEFASACHEVSGGNPFLLAELLGEAARVGVSPDSEGAMRLRALVPEGIARAVLLRLQALGVAAVALARAVAMMGSEAPLAQAASVADLPVGSAVSQADALVRAGVFRDGQELELAHPTEVETMFHAALDELGHRSPMLSFALRSFGAAMADFGAQFDPRPVLPELLEWAQTLSSPELVVRPALAVLALAACKAAFPVVVVVAIARRALGDLAAHRAAIELGFPMFPALIVLAFADEGGGIDEALAAAYHERADALAAIDALAPLLDHRPAQHADREAARPLRSAPAVAIAHLTSRFPIASCRRSTMSRSRSSPASWSASPASRGLASRRCSEFSPASLSPPPALCCSTALRRLASSALRSPGSASAPICSPAPWPTTSRSAGPTHTSLTSSALPARQASAVCWPGFPTA